MTEEAVETEDIERVHMKWPTGLKDRVREHAGTRGLTDFVVGAVETRLVDEDRVVTLEREVNELHHLAQLLADRYVMGGDHENRAEFLMEVSLPSWMRTEGWPPDLAKQVPNRESVAEVVSHTPTQPPPVVGQPAPAPISTPVETVTESTEAEADDEDLHRPMFMTGQGSAFFDRVKEAGAAKGIDMSGAGLVPASSLPKPNPREHNHGWQRDEQGELRCDCGAWIDRSDPEYPNGIVRDDPHAQEAAEQPAPPAAEPAPASATPDVQPTPVPPTRDLTTFEVDF